MLQLHSVFDGRQGPIDFSSGLITVCEGKVHKEFQACSTQELLSSPYRLLPLQLARYFSVAFWTQQKNLQRKLTDGHGTYHKSHYRLLFPYPYYNTIASLDLKCGLPAVHGNQLPPGIIKPHTVILIIGVHG